MDTVNSLTWVESLWGQATALTAWEIVAVITGILTTIGMIRNRIWNYAFGIASAMVSVWLYFNVQLFGQLLINLYYCVMSAWGWYFWVSTNNKPQGQIRYCQNKGRLFIVMGYLFAVLLLFTINGLISVMTASESAADGASWLEQINRVWQSASREAWFDAASTGAAVVGMVLLVLRRIENWLAWLVADAIAIPLNWMVGYYFYTFLTLVWTVMAIWGLIHWQRLHAEQRRLHHEAV